LGSARHSQGRLQTGERNRLQRQVHAGLAALALMMLGACSLATEVVQSGGPIQGGHGAAATESDAEMSRVARAAVATFVPVDATGPEDGAVTSPTDGGPAPAAATSPVDI